MFTGSTSLEEALLQNFIYQKLEISYAINKPFPFFESLRDKSFITERLYVDSLEACRNLVPLPRVVYNVLTNLERTFDVPLLEELFSPINLCEYPNLEKIRRSFREAPAAKASSSIHTALQDLLPQLTSLPPHWSHLPGAESFSQPAVSTLQRTKSLAEAPNPAGPATDIPGLSHVGGVSPAPVAKASSSIRTPLQDLLPQLTCLPPHWGHLPCAESFSQPAVSTLQRTESLAEAPNPAGPATDIPGVSHVGGVSPERSEEETVDSHSPQLPVTCGEVRGVLYKDKMERGPSKKCVHNEKGAWFTPEGSEMTEKQSDISGECEVCCRGGQLLCCDTCLKYFHEDCHIPPVGAERSVSSWSCTFCRMLHSPGSAQRLRESGILERRIRPMDQLKCEFLLLKAYCHPQSTFFTNIPHNILDYGKPFKEAMWLDLVKERLVQKMYTVAWFLRDVRLIFRNHQIFYKASDLGKVGLDLEAEFEKDVKEVFGFCEVHKSWLALPGSSCS
ncbi:sp110 nuclear body protein-like [Rhynchocyon petersi]